MKPKKKSVPFKFTYPVRIFGSNEDDEQQGDYEGKQNPEQKEEEDVQGNCEENYQSDQVLEEENLEAVLGQEEVSAATEALLALPLDVFLNILSMLPIKSLALCRCVCKTWRTIVHHPHFTLIHHFKATQPKYHSWFNRSARLVFNLKFHGGNNDMDDAVHFLEHETDDMFDNAVLVNPSFCLSDFKIVGSCNGLLCVVPDFCSHSFYIWNPTIGEYIIIPRAYRGTKVDYYNCVTGFAFDQTVGKYKLISMYLKQYEVPNGEPILKMAGEIFTIGSNEWKMLADVPFPIHRASSMVFVNGAFHWMGDDNGVVSRSEVIVAFDVVSEEFRIVPAPPGLIPSCIEAYLWVTPHTCNQRLGDIGGCLSIFDYSSLNCCEIWVMKNYGVKPSWTKQYVITQKEVGRFSVVPRPVSMMRNGNILMVVDDECLISYDPTRKSHRIIGKICKGYKLCVISHVGSFLSPQDIVGPTNRMRKTSTTRWYGSLRLIRTQYDYRTCYEALT